MDKVLCHFYANTYYDEWRVVITDYTDGKNPISDNASPNGINAYNTSASESCKICNSAIYAGVSPSSSNQVVQVCLFANEAFVIQTQFKRSQDSEWINSTSQNYNQTNNGFYTITSNAIEFSNTTLLTSGIVSSGLNTSKEITSELDIPIFSDFNEYKQFVLSPVPSASVEVSYDIPQGDYEYVKLVFKKDRIPADVNDGYAVDLDPTATSVEVEGVSKTIGTKYYFAIFTDKSVSDEFSYEVTAPVPRFSIAKQFKSDNGTFNYNIPSWMEEKILQVLENNPSETSIWFDVENYPAVEGLYSHQFVEYPLQFRTYYGTYPETGSRPSTSYYIAKDFKLEWLWVSGNLSRDNTDYYKSNGEWVSGYTSGAGSFGRADSNFESSVALFFILDNRTKKGYPTFIIWAHSERWSGRKYQCNISKMGTNAQYDNVASAIYNALK